jgi:hypothetical protein
MMHTCLMSVTVSDDWQSLCQVPNDEGRCFGVSAMHLPPLLFTTRPFCLPVHAGQFPGQRYGCIFGQLQRLLVRKTASCTCLHWSRLPPPPARRLCNRGNCALYLDLLFKCILGESRAICHAKSMPGGWLASAVRRVAVLCVVRSGAGGCRAAGVQSRPERCQYTPAGYRWNCPLPPACPKVAAPRSLPTWEDRGDMHSSESSTQIQGFRSKAELQLQDRASAQENRGGCSVFFPCR